MARITKAQNGKRAAKAKAAFESSKNPKVTYPSFRWEFGTSSPQRTAVTTDTTGYASGKKKFPAVSYDRVTRFSNTYKEPKGTYKMESRGAVERGMKRMGITPKKTGGKVAKQLGRMKTTIGNKSFAKKRK